MSETNNETDNVMQLLLSGQLESITLGLTIADSLEIDIEDFKKDIEELYDWIVRIHRWEKSVVLLSEKIYHLVHQTHIYCSDKDASTDFVQVSHIPTGIKYMVNLISIDLSYNRLWNYLLKLVVLLIWKNCI
ncbi:hypothetical protein QNI16_34685 [Cytophagaceae bacterium YF14B1]|uniref:Uncharacterized protein n=1 Tax=Xanthocytophaga flava TaxID=3048013 RepID=A0AAE3QUF9_9BACT|nr:hypothetical protein [Xanthocytophaga flavus]MDJ1485685.1 hypothetical protein [Xanthocytophaga flavus]